MKWFSSEMQDGDGILWRAWVTGLRLDVQYVQYISQWREIQHFWISFLCHEFAHIMLSILKDNFASPESWMNCRLQWFSSGPVENEWIAVHCSFWVLEWVFVCAMSAAPETSLVSVFVPCLLICFTFLNPPCSSTDDVQWFQCITYIHTWITIPTHAFNEMSTTTFPWRNLASDGSC